MGWHPPPHEKVNMKIKNIILLVTAVLFTAGCAGIDARMGRISTEITDAGRRHDDAAINKLAASITPSDLSQDHLRG